MRHPKPDDFIPETHFPADWPIERRRGTHRCQSWNPNEGRQCANSPMGSGSGNGFRCDSHGGKTPSGIASPNLKTGLYSHSLPARLGTQYKELLKMGENLFRIDDETAVISTLIQEQLDRIDEGESAATWKKLRELYDEMAVIGSIPNKTPSDIAEFNNLFTRIGRIVNYGAGQWMARAEAVKLIEQKRKLVADERKDQAAKHTAMSFDRVLLIMTALVASVKQALEKHIDNDKDRRLVLSDTQTFLNKVISE